MEPQDAHSVDRTLDVCSVDGPQDAGGVGGTPGCAWCGRHPLDRTVWTELLDVHGVDGAPEHTPV